MGAGVDDSKQGDSCASGDAGSVIQRVPQPAPTLSIDRSASGDAPGSPVATTAGAVGQIFSGMWHQIVGCRGQLILSPVAQASESGSDTDEDGFNTVRGLPTANDAVTDGKGDVVSTPAPPGCLASHRVHKWHCTGPATQSSIVWHPTPAMPRGSCKSHGSKSWSAIRID